MGTIDDERDEAMTELKCYIQSILDECRNRPASNYQDPVRKASFHGYMEAIREILEYIEDNE